MARYGGQGKSAASGQRANRKPVRSAWSSGCSEGSAKSPEATPSTSSINSTAISVRVPGLVLDELTPAEVLAMYRRNAIIAPSGMDFTFQASSVYNDSTVFDSHMGDAASAARAHQCLHHLRNP